MEKLLTVFPLGFLKFSKAVNNYLIRAVGFVNNKNHTNRIHLIEQAPKKSLALFDFDGTLTTQDTLSGFIKYARGNSSYYIGLIRFAPTYIKWKLGLIEASPAKEQLLKQFFEGCREQRFKSLASSYSLYEIDKIIRDELFTLFKLHKDKGHRVIIVSASIKDWLEPWCKKNEVELLCTELLYKNSKFSGEFIGKNCNAEEKSSKIIRYLDILEYDIIFAYGDSNGDEAMLDLANHSYRI